MTVYLRFLRNSMSGKKGGPVALWKKRTYVCCYYFFECCTASSKLTRFKLIFAATRPRDADEDDWGVRSQVPHNQQTHPAPALYPMQAKPGQQHIKQHPFDQRRRLNENWTTSDSSGTDVVICDSFFVLRTRRNNVCRANVVFLRKRRA